MSSLGGASDTSPVLRVSDIAWREAVVNYIRLNAKPADKYDHQPRLYSLACEIGRGMKYDDDVVFAAAWLHDLGVFVGHRPEDPQALAHWDNTAYACRETPGVLRRCGYPEEKIPAVVEVIRTHQPHATPLSTEATIVRDADLLEQLGTVAVVRAMAKIGRDTRYPTYHEVVPVLEKALRELPSQLRLPSSQRLVLPKVGALRAFLESLKQETDLPS